MLIKISRWQSKSELRIPRQIGSVKEYPIEAAKQKAMTTGLQV